MHHCHNLVSLKIMHSTKLNFQHKCISSLHGQTHPVGSLRGLTIPMTFFLNLVFTPLVATRSLSVVSEHKAFDSLYAIKILAVWKPPSVALVSPSCTTPDFHPKSGISFLSLFIGCRFYPERSVPTLIPMSASRSFRGDGDGGAGKCQYTRISTQCHLKIDKVPAAEGDSRKW